MWAAIIISAVAGYLIGSIQWGIVIGRVTRGVDIRDYGSGATGTTNVIRTSGAKAGAIALVLDVAKGIVPVYLGFAIARLFGVDAHDDQAWAAAAGALAAVIGHCWPVYYGFRGGKAVASGFGAALAMNPLASVAMLPLAALVVGVTRTMSVMTIAMTPLLAALFVVLAALDISPWAWAAYAVPTAIIIVYRHRANIERIIAGTEPQIGKGGDKKAAEYAETGAAEEPVTTRS